MRIRRQSFFSYADNEGPDVEERYACTLSLTSALDGGEWLKQSSGLPPGKRPGVHCTGGGLALGPVITNAVISRLPAFKPRNFQSVASRNWCVAILCYMLM